MRSKVVFLAGPTASGKTEIAVHLAKKMNAEIISCDSMQVYRGMDILTSKPQAALRKRVTHHLLDIVSPRDDYNVSCYRRQALVKIREIIKKGKTPLFVGGSGLYLSVLVDGLFKSPPLKKSLSLALYREAQDKGSAYLYRRLKIVDPEAALRIHQNDTRRIVRALEVFQATGKPISVLQKERRGLGRGYDIRIFCLDLPREELYRRIDKRVEKMFKQGLLQEAKKLLASKLSRTAGAAIGLKEVKGYLNGCYDLKEAKRLIQRNSRWYAKRQLTWFRKDKRIEWIKVGAKLRPAGIACIISGELN